MVCLSIQSLLRLTDRARGYQREDGVRRHGHQRRARHDHDRCFVRSQNPGDALLRVRKPRRRRHLRSQRRRRFAILHRNATRRSLADRKNRRLELNDSALAVARASGPDYVLRYCRVVPPSRILQRNDQLHRHAEVSAKDEGQRPPGHRALSRSVLCSGRSGFDHVHRSLSDSQNQVTLLEILFD